MKRGKSEFGNKFHLLNSQENSQEIINWSSSDSSDYENIFRNDGLDRYTTDRKHKLDSRKRKRNSKRNKSLKNISNLDINYEEETIENKETSNKISPILKSKVTTCLSPILFQSQQNVSLDVNKQPQSIQPTKNKSPILPFSQSLYHNIHKSPILLSKCKSPRTSPRVRKKLFNNNHADVNLNLSKIVSKNDDCIRQVAENTRLIGDPMLSPLKNKSKSESYLPNNNFVEIVSDKTDKDLIKIVKSYFDNHFNSETNSLHSISEYESTPKNISKTSEEIDIISLSDDNEKFHIELAKSDTSIDVDDMKKSKGYKYKKDGLAYRLHMLMKKQNASLSLWYHERFLANNSRFVMPKGEFTAFRILNVQLKYGCYLIDSRDINNDSYCIWINIVHANSITVEANALLKLYKPYRCFTVNHRKLILNVVKFECDKMLRI